jgi:hypothetical protein
LREAVRKAARWGEMVRGAASKERTPSALVKQKEGNSRPERTTGKIASAVSGARRGVDRMRRSMRR